MPIPLLFAVQVKCKSRFLLLSIFFKVGPTLKTEKQIIIIHHIQLEPKWRKNREGCKVGKIKTNIFITKNVFLNC